MPFLACLLHAATAAQGPSPDSSKLQPEELWVMITCASCFVLFGSFYAFIVNTVPRKQGLDFRTRLDLHLSFSMQGNIAEIWVAIFSLGSCVLFIVDTYMVATPIELFIMELIFSWLFFFQFFVDLCCAKQRLEFLYSRDALVDIITVTPILIMAFTSTYNPIHTGENSSTGFLRFTRVVKVTRVFRLIRLLKVVRVVASPIEDAIRMKTTELASLVISLVIITAGIVQFLAQNFGSDWGGCEPTIEQPVCPDLSFHDAFYFTVVTMSSVGYGDISPKDVVGRMCMVVMIVFALVVVLPKVDELSNILSFRSRYGGTVKGSKDLAMVLLGCDPGNGLVSEFIPQQCLKFLGHT